jgi:hypothetical protein
LIASVILAEDRSQPAEPSQLCERLHIDAEQFGDFLGGQEHGGLRHPCSPDNRKPGSVITHRAAAGFAERVEQ